MMPRPRASEDDRLVAVVAVVTVAVALIADQGVMALASGAQLTRRDSLVARCRRRRRVRLPYISTKGPCILSFLNPPVPHRRFFLTEI